MIHPLQHLTRWLRSRQEKHIRPITLRPERMSETRVLPDRETLISRLPAGAVVAEVGVDMGDFSKKILDISNPVECHLIDLWPPSLVRADRYTAVAQRFSREAADGRVILHRGDSEATLESFPDHHFDWIYLDTTHLFEKTGRELEICARKIKTNGWLCGHDYTLGSWKDGVRYGVIRAVNDFCNREGWDLVFLTNEPHRYISYALKRSH